MSPVLPISRTAGSCFCLLRCGTSAFALIVSLQLSGLGVGPANAQATCTPAPAPTPAGQVRADGNNCTVAGGTFNTGSAANAADFIAQNGGAIEVTAPVTLRTGGDDAAGIFVQSNGAVVFRAGAAGSTITTTGARAFGLHSFQASGLSGQALTITTSGAGSHAVLAQNGGQIGLTSSTVNATAANAIHLYALNADVGTGTPSRITATNSAVRLTAAGAIGAKADAGGVITIVGGSVSTVTNANGQTGLLSTVADSRIEATGATIAIGTGTTVLSNLLAVRAENGGAISLTDTAVSTRGGATGTANNGMLATGTNSAIAVSGGSLSTLSANSTVARAEAGGSIGFTGTAISTMASATGQRGLVATGTDGSGTRSAITVNGGTLTMGTGTTAASNMVAVHALDGGNISLTGTVVSVAGGNSGATSFLDHGLLASDAGSAITLSGGSVTTTSRGSFGARAESGALITLGGGATIGTTGPVSAATGVPANTGSHGLTAIGSGSRIVASNITVTTGVTGISGSGAFANAARAEDAATISLTNATLGTIGSTAHALLAAGAGSRITGDGITVTTTGAIASGARAEGGATMSFVNGSSFITAAGLSHTLHALGSGSTIEGSGITASAAGLNTNAARAEDGAIIALTGGSLATTGGGSSESLNAAAADVRTGGTMRLSSLTISTTGARADGMHADGAGSRIDADNVTVSTIWTQGNAAANAADVQNGGTVAVVDSSLTSVVTAVAVGFAGNASGSTFSASNTAIAATGPTAVGVRVIAASSATLTGGSVTTQGINSPALEAGNGTITATNVAIRTTGIGRSYGAVSSGNSTVTLNGGSIVTQGESENPFTANARRPEGMSAFNPGGILNSAGTSVLTSGVEGFGVVADDGGIVTLSSNPIFTGGFRAIGLYAGIDQAGPQFLVSITGGDLTVLTQGDGAHGGYVSRDFFEATATMTLTGGTITTHGAGADGLRAVNGATLAASQTVVRTEGPDAVGVVSRYFLDAVVPDPRSAPTLVTLDRVSVTTLGDRAHGALVHNGGVMGAAGTDVTVGGANAAALLAVGEIGPASIASFSDSRLINANGPTIGVAGAANLSFTRSLIGRPLGDPAGSNAQWLLVGTTGDFRLLGGDLPIIDNTDPLPDPSALEEDPAPEEILLLAAAETASPLALSGLANISVFASTVTGSAITLPGSISNVTLGEHSVWDMTGSSNLTSLTNSQSQIIYSAPVGDPQLLSSYKTLTTVNYAGAGGMIGFNTFLGSDGSPSDRLVIDGGGGTGNSLLRIANTTGPGDLTIGNGILVVDAINGATTAARAFALQGFVIAGPYEYLLYHGSADASAPSSWFLRSTIDCSGPDAPSPPCPSPTPTPTPTPTPSPTPTPTPQPNYRQETSLYSAVTSLMRTYGLDLLDTLHERVGEEEQLRGDPALRDEDRMTGTWGRFLYRKGHAQGDLRGALKLGPSYESKLFAFQIGVDVYRHEEKREEGATGDRDHVGLMAALGQVDADVDHHLLDFSIPTGKAKIQGISIGAYWTHFEPNGAYIDGVAQGTLYTVGLQSPRLAKASTDGFGLALSLEGGYPLHLDDDWQLEPQAQLVYQMLDLDDFDDPAAKIRFSNLDSLVGRIGLRLANTGKSQGWLRGNIWHEFLGEPRTEFSSASGFIPFSTSLSRTWWELGAGMSIQLEPRITLYGQGDYNRGFSGDFHAWEAKGGLRINW